MESAMDTSVMDTDVEDAERPNDVKRRNDIAHRFFKLFENDNGQNDAKLELIHSILKLLDDGEITDSTRKCDILERLLSQLSADTGALLPEKLVAAESFLKSLEHPNMCATYLHELTRFCDAEWPALVERNTNASTLPEIRYIDRLEEKLAILQAISEAEIPSQYRNKPKRRIDPSRVTVNVWAAFWVATVEELQEFLESTVRSGTVPVEMIERQLVAVSGEVPTVESAVMNKRTIGTSSQATSSRPATPSQQATSSRPATPSQQATPSKPGASSQQATPSKPATSSQPVTPSKPATSSQPVTPSKPTASFQQAMGKSGVGSSIQSLPDKGKGKEKATRKESSIRDTKTRDNEKCTLLHTAVTEAAHIYPVAKIEAAEACRASLGVLDFIWGGDTCEKFKDALGVKDLDLPMNMVTLDNAPHHLWDHGKISLPPVLSTPNRIDLMVRILEPLDWSKRKRAGSALPDGLATDPRTKVKKETPLDPTSKHTKKTVKELTDICFVSADTQHRIYDGHRFSITSDEPDLLPSAELLRLRDRVMAMMTLKGGADVDDDVLSSSSGGDDAPRVLIGDGYFEGDLEDKVLEWNERAEGELAPLSVDEVDEMAWTSSVIQQPETVGDIFPPEGQPEDRGESRGDD
ncbi:Levansucrase [Colletotrichum siamense]|uniref:Levansucrase n=1 Tax=Colletotrichum siamense TaxID=690259 RepID=UPI0018733CA2|nr:Levansucrase [Colletotrichum siamense]KAF5494653.1 Levansucrase [Colletotrichum siamense]